MKKELKCAIVAATLAFGTFAVMESVDAAGVTLAGKQYTGTKIVKGGSYTGDTAAIADGEGNRLQFEKSVLSGAVVAENGGLISLEGGSVQASGRSLAARNGGTVSTKSTEIMGGALSDGGTMFLESGSIQMNLDDRLAALGQGCILGNADLI